MATRTKNLNLIKPEQNDFYNVDEFNGNFQKIDDFVGTTNSKFSYLDQYQKIVGSSSITYHKVFTITPTVSGYKDATYIFDMVGRSKVKATVEINLSTANDNYFNSVDVTYEGDVGIAGRLKVYCYTDEVNATSRIEVWCEVVDWNEIEFFPKTFYNRNSCVKLEWNLSLESAFPTDFTTQIPVTAAEWAGNAASATTVKPGTFSGQMKANTDATSSVGVYQIRNIAADTTDLTAGSSSLATGSVYLVYE